MESVRRVENVDIKTNMGKFHGETKSYTKCQELSLKNKKVHVTKQQKCPKQKFSNKNS